MEALTFISGGTIDPRRIASSSAKAQVVAAMLANGRYLFVLDGLEVLQRQEGDDYGTLTSPDLVIKGWIAGFLGLFLACVGRDMLQFYPRFTFGIPELDSGVEDTVFAGSERKRSAFDRGHSVISARDPQDGSRSTVGTVEASTASSSITSSILDIVI